MTPLRQTRQLVYGHSVSYYTNFYQKNSLFGTKKDEDLTSCQGFQELYHWNNMKRDKKLLDIDNESTRDLLQKLQ